VQANPVAANGKEVIAPINATGVAVCDDYIQRYRACMNSGSVPEADIAPMQTVFMRRVTMWQKAIADGKGAGVAPDCVAADKQARKKFTKVGCAY
jgi:hypothetical protein